MGFNSGFKGLNDTFLADKAPCSAALPVYDTSLADKAPCSAALPVYDTSLADKAPCSAALPVSREKFILYRTGGSVKRAQHSVLRQAAFCKLRTAPQVVWCVCGNRVPAV